MAATWLHFRSRIQHLPKALQTGNGFCMEFFVQVQWSSWRVHSCSPSLPLLLAARERRAVQYTRRVQVKPSYLMGNRALLGGEIREIWAFLMLSTSFWNSTHMAADCLVGQKGRQVHCLRRIFNPREEGVGRKGRQVS